MTPLPRSRYGQTIIPFLPAQRPEQMVRTRALESRRARARYFHGFLATTFPFSQTTIGVPYIRAVFLARRAARRMTLATDSKKRLFSLVVLFVFTASSLSVLVLHENCPRCVAWKASAWIPPR